MCHRLPASGKGIIALLLASLACFVGTLICAQENRAAESPELTISWKDNILSINGDFPGEQIDIWYLEAYCRPGSTDREWNETVIGHETRLIQASEDRTSLELECTLADGVIVRHRIRTVSDGVTFDIMAKNPTEKVSTAHWAQPCIRVGRFTGTDAEATDDKYAYLAKSFIFLDDKLERLPTRRWAVSARYEPGQVWCPKDVDRGDVNPRPLSPLVPSNGLIGCFSNDESHLLAVAFEPFQELFQGVIRCLHSDFRIGGLKSGEQKNIRGKIYIMRNDEKALRHAYTTDFPSQ
ncbi:MAG: hypothetical protein ACI9R3_002847 [Verrucomicrobiales bacterium]|jgi:hypothetical protein